MHLEKFKQASKRKKILFVFSGVFLFLLTVVGFRSYAVYQEQQEYDAIEGKVPSFLEDFDVKLAVTIDGVAQTKFPKKTDGKAVNSIICDKGASASWDYKNWTIIVKNVTETRTKCQVNFASKYSESILNGADPVLADGMIPVTIEDNGVVKKASLGSEWYSYQNKKWANVVILNDEYITYSEGETIPEENIESYFVWIPRYRYQIFNDGKYPTQTGVLVDNKLPSKVQEIRIEFENKDTSVSNGSSVGSWLTHPAFTSFNTNGMWVGKFETGYKGSIDKVSAQQNVKEPEKVQIKPNVNSWREISVSNAFYTGYDYRKNYNSHMMKNTEWGAIAYLSHSKYGSMQSVRINNNSSYVTGYAAVNEPTCGYTEDNRDCNKYGTEASITQTYNTSTGYLASTTTNITGVYDMSGGSWEYVMGVMLDKNNKPLSGQNYNDNSGFNGTFGCPNCDVSTSGLTELTTGIPFPTDTRYYDQYEYVENDETYQRRILGDATGEMGPFATATYGSLQRQIGSWYADGAWFVTYWGPWFMRGGLWSTGLGAGVFDFDDGYGHGSPNVSFRIVLSI